MDCEGRVDAHPSKGKEREERGEGKKSGKENVSHQVCTSETEKKGTIIPEFRIHDMEQGNKSLNVRSPREGVEF